MNKTGAMLLTEVIDGVGRHKPAVVYSLLNDEKREVVAGQDLKSTYNVHYVALARGPSMRE